jgi:hypothetical protein
VAGSTTTYTYTINGGSNYTFGSWTVIGGTLGAATGNQVTVTWGQDTGANEGSISYSVFCGADTRIGLKLVDVTAIPVTPVVTTRYYELGGCNPSLAFAYTTIVPDGVNQRFVIPTQPDVFYIYNGASSLQSTPPTGYSGSFQKTTQYNCP